MNLATKELVFPFIVVALESRVLRQLKKLMKFTRGSSSEKLFTKQSVGKRNIP